MAAIKAVHVSDIPILDHIPDSTTASTLYSTFFSSFAGNNSRTNKFHVIGHRGSGMNMLQSPDLRMKSIKENSIMSFNAASKFPIDFVEFDVQVTSDGCPVIFHDNFIVSQENLTLAELLCYGPQRDVEKLGKPLLRKIKDGRIFDWNVEHDDSICTLQEYAKERPIIFSTFQPDAAELINKLFTFSQMEDVEVYTDVRRNSLEEAMKLCLKNGFQGIVSKVKAFLKIQECNVAEAVYMQHIMGVGRKDYHFSSRNN
ncbi:hypothetical protein MKW92_020734 [Papaver armeniacum]|nr:hypothetical protein MKW92_020734 [Papaver armeniacum]